MKTIPTNFLTATETQALLIAGKVTPEQILLDHIDRYQERDGEIGAWVHVNHCKSVIEGKGPLAGVVLGVKDIMGEVYLGNMNADYRSWLDTKDLPTEQGCEIYTGAQAGVDAAAVGICRTAGAAIMGKTVSGPTS